MRTFEVLGCFYEGFRFFKRVNPYFYSIQGLASFQQVDHVSLRFAMV